MTTILGIIALVVVIWLLGMITPAGWAGIAVVAMGIGVFFFVAFILRIAYFILIGKNPFK